MSLIQAPVKPSNPSFDPSVRFMWKRIDASLPKAYRLSLLDLSQSLLSGMVAETGLACRILSSHTNSLQHLLHSLAHVASNPLMRDGIKVSLRPASFGPRGKDHPGLSYKPFRLVLDLLEACSYCEIEKGFWNHGQGQRTLVRPTVRLNDLMLGHGLIWASHPYPVLVKPADPMLMLNTHPEKRGKQMSCLIRPLSDREAVLPRLNDLIGRTRIEIAWGSYEDYERSFDPDKGYSRAHPNRTSFYRSFRHDDGIGGRLAGHWLPEAPKAVRRLVTFNGLPTIELDFKSFHPVLAYDQCGVPALSADLYEIPGWPNTKANRARFKLIWNKCVNGKKAIVTGDDIERSGIERAHRGKAAIRFDEGDAQRMVDAFWDHHDALRHLIGSEAWKTLQFRESEIMLDVLGILVAQGIPAIPIHDGVRVAKIHEHELYAAMTEATKHLTMPPAISGYGLEKVTLH